MVVLSALGWASLRPSEKSPAKAQKLAVGLPAPEFRGMLLDGSRVTRKSLHGKPAVVNFFATWCTPCLGELPYFDRLHRTSGDRLQVLMVNVGDGRTGAYLRGVERVSLPGCIRRGRTHERGFLRLRHSLVRGHRCPGGSPSHPPRPRPRLGRPPRACAKRRWKVVAALRPLPPTKPGEAARSRPTGSDLDFGTCAEVCRVTGQALDPLATRRCRVRSGCWTDSERSWSRCRDAAWCRLPTIKRLRAMVPLAEPTDVRNAGQKARKLGS